MQTEDYFEGDEPPVNKALHDILAIAGGDEVGETQLLAMWLMLGAEKLARVAGRTIAREQLQGLDRWVRDAQPSNPWKD